MYGNINNNSKSPFVYSAQINNLTVHYTDKGWLNNGVKCCDHSKHGVDNSLYQFRATDYIYICDTCCAFWHVDMGD
jgi:hypothetical protein